VRANNLSPNNAGLGALNSLASAIDEGNTLTEVELSRVAILDALQLQKGDVGVLGVAGAKYPKKEMQR
jgi:hypothetical protein